MREETKFQLFYLAEALSRAKRLEKSRADFHEELYESIIYPSFELDPMIEREFSSATDSQAIRIIDAKERYERMIHKEYDRSVRWKLLLEWLDEQDKLIAIRYFEKKKSVQPKIINRLLSKIEMRLEIEERYIEQEREDQAEVDYKRYMKKTQAFRKTIQKPSADGDKKQYLIRGRLVHLTVEEYEAYQLEQTAAIAAE